MRVSLFSNKALGSKLDFVVPDVHNDSYQIAPPSIPVVKQDFARKALSCPNKRPSLRLIVVDLCQSFG
ncbi:MAG: hypothetical protein CFE27_04825 [Alphaproteobacteria bacterium PA1]|nr:MAG: hypothetical protein CFE27_04825 [Alphaproteobacteria bacterium PA1]